MRERLDVVHQGRAARDTALMRARRGERRPGGAARQELHDRRLLARGVTVGYADDLDRHRVDPGHVPGLGRGLQSRTQPGRAVVQDQVGLGRADRVRRDRYSVHDQVRRPGQQETVLCAGGLALGAVGDHHGGPAAVSDRPELPPGGEAGAAAADQARPLHAVDQTAGTPAERQRPEDHLMLDQTRRTLGSEARQQPRPDADRRARCHDGCHRPSLTVFPARLRAPAAPRPSGSLKVRALPPWSRPTRRRPLRP